MSDEKRTRLNDDDDERPTLFSMAKRIANTDSAMFHLFDTSRGNQSRSRPQF